MMGFAATFSALSNSMITTATGFVSDFSPILAALIGVAFGGYAMMVVRRFV